MSERGLDRLEVDGFVFRGIHPDIYMGTASDRYAGWIGQVYTGDLYSGRITSRTKKIKGRAFKEEVLPVECVAEFFQHFRVLEIDFTFYQPLMDETGKPTSSFHALRAYRDHLTTGDCLILKAPQVVLAQKIMRGGQFANNEKYLSPGVFSDQFHGPATELLGSHIKGFIFEQEYQRKATRTSDKELVAALAHFFAAIPRDDRYHLELRTESYLTEPVFELLEEFGVGQVLSHWTWLPSLKKQFERAKQRFLNSGKQAVIRLLTPLGTRYEDAYAMAHPFDKLKDNMLQPGMIQDTVQLMREGIRQQIQTNVIINNRAGGNAPRIAQLITTQFLAGGENDSF